MMPDDARGQFASTFKEWHYLIGGAAAGFIVGLWAGLLWFLAHEVVRR